MRRHIALKSILFVSVILLSSHILCPNVYASLKAGCSKVNITPPLGIPLIGSKGKPSDDIIDELYAKALVLNDGRTTIAIVSADLLYTPLEEITNPIRKIIEEKIGIPGRNVLICATHTHSGPEVFTKSKLGPDTEIPASRIDQFYLQTLIRKTASSVMIAYKNMQDVKIGAAKGQIPEIVYNRRPKLTDGSVKMAFTLPPEVTTTKKIETDAEGNVKVTFTTADEEAELDFGPIDPEVCVLRVEDMNGGIVSSLVNFGCHPVCIYPYFNTTISADYPAYTMQVVEQIEGGISLFALGLAGNTVPIQRGVVPRQQIGKALGGEALRRLQFITTSSNVTLNTFKKEIRFPIKTASSSDKSKDADEKNYITTEIQVLRLGDIYILGLPGEILVEVGLEIKKRAGVEKLFVISLSNDTIGYVCHSQAYKEGGYEPGSGTNLEKGAGEIMINQALDLISQIKQGG
jgi:hypothetical protein